MTLDKFIFIDVRELVRSERMANTMGRIFESMGQEQIAVINFLRLEAEAPAKYREFLYTWVSSEYKSVPLLFINVKEDLKINLLTEDTASLLSDKYLIIPVFGQYCELMGWIGLDEKEDETDRLLREIIFEGNVSEDYFREHSGVLKILWNNRGLFHKSGNAWSAVAMASEVFEAEIKQEISKRNAHIKRDHIEISPLMHSEEYIEAIRFIEDPHLIERIARQLYTMIKPSVDNLQCIVTFGDPGAILASAFRSLLQSHGKDLPYVVFENEESPSPINPERLEGKRVLILFDVVCAGELLEKICRWIESEGGIVGEIATVVNINVTKKGRCIDQIRRLCEYTFETSTPGECKDCIKGHLPKKPDPYLKTIRPVPHQEPVYFMDVLDEYRDEVIRFWEMVDKAGALREHVRITDKDRHYFFYVDTYSIFKMREHMASVLEILSLKMAESIHGFPKRITFLHPPNLSAQLLAEELRRFWSDQRGIQRIPYPQDIYVVSAFSEEGKLKVHERNDTLIRGSILILDDGANTGDTLRSLIGIANRDDVERIDACIFDDRLSPEERASLKRVLAGKKGKLISLFEVPIATYIGNPGECFFCRERKNLEELKESLTTPQAINYCTNRIEELKPLEMTERALAFELLTERREPKIKLRDIEVSKKVFKAIVLHLKGRLRREDRAGIPVFDILDDKLEPSMKVAIIETLDEKEIQNPRVFQSLMNLLTGTKDPRLFETIIRVLANIRDWRFRNKLKDSRIEKIPREKLPYFAFLNELCQLKNGREIDTWWPNIRERMEGTGEEIEQIETISRVRGGLIGESAAIKEMLDFIKKAALTSSTVLLTGESGTGKELVAKAIHSNSVRASKSFIPGDCASLAENLLESELFGHVRGAFTGAIKERIGLFEKAHGGTVFLDEIGNISLSVQTKLLRVLQEHEVKRVGGEETIKIDVRIIAATNKNLKQLVTEGKFREDLFYRLNVVAFQLLPLRERPEDIPVLADYFLRKYAAESKKTVDKISHEALDLLIHYHWPGNVRELQNCIQHALVYAEGETLEPDNLPALLILETQKIGRKGHRTLEEIERRAILDALAEFQGNQSRAAKSLGISEKDLRFKMQKLGISNPYPVKPGRPKKNSAQ